MASPDHARRVLDFAALRAPTLGAARLICIDGPAGSGKTTLARQIQELAPEAQVLHTDDLLDGWRGLPRMPATLATLMHPLSLGQPSAYRRFDWSTLTRAEEHLLHPGGLIVVEGVSCASIPHQFITALVWVEVSDDVRVQRGLLRDGVEMAWHWQQWMRDEVEHFAAYPTKARADVIIDGTQT